MRVLVTGSTGLVGSALTRALTDAGIVVDTVTRVEGAETPTRCVSSADGSRRWLVAWPVGLRDIPYAEYDTVIHLAIPPISGREPVEHVVEAHTKPVEIIATGIERAGNSCLLLFASSQSASSRATSRYGRGKWESEQLLRRSSIRWTILRPGLIVAPTSRGLFASIVRLVQLSPVIIVPSGKDVRVEPVVLGDIVAACVEIARAPRQHANRTYELALPGRSFKELVTEVSALLGRSRWVIPANWRCFALMLRVSSIIPSKLLSYRESLLGLVGSDRGSVHAGAESLGISLHALTKESLPHCAATPPPSEGEYLFKSLFHAAPPQELLIRYANYQIPDLLNGTWIDIEAIVRKRLNAEAIEFATRRKNTILSQKMMILCYVSELFPSCASFFINKSNSRLKAFASLGLSGVKAVWSLVYGTYLVKRHRLLERKAQAEPMLTRLPT